MTIFREDRGYEPLTPERAAEFGVDPADAGLWFIEYDYCPMPTWGKGDGVPEGTSARLIPNTMARLARGKPILILGES